MGEAADVTFTEKFILPCFMQNKSFNGNSLMGMLKINIASGVLLKIYSIDIGISTTV